jgi:hypothetical protein
LADSELRIPSSEDIRKVLADDDGRPADAGAHGGGDGGTPPPSSQETDPEDIPHA